MMVIHVDPPHLRGYADQLDGNVDVLSEMQDYRAKYCGDTTGMTGVLALMTGMVESNSDTMRGLMDAAMRKLNEVSNRLDLTASNYHSADVDGAYGIKETEVVALDFGDDSGFQGSEVVDSTEIVTADPDAVAGGYGDGADVVYTTPDRNTEFAEWAVDEVSGLFDFGPINDVIEYLTGIDLLGAATEAIIADPSTLTSLSTAWDTVAVGFDAIADDLETGVAKLAENWYGDEGGAAQAFIDHLVRDTWIPCFEALSDLCDGVAGSFYGLALSYENIIRALIFALKLYMGVIKKLIRDLAKAYKGKKWLDAVEALFDLVMEVMYFIEEIVGTIVRQIEMFYETVMSFIDLIQVAIDMIQGDLDVLA